MRALTQARSSSGALDRRQRAGQRQRLRRPTFTREAACRPAGRRRPAPRRPAARRRARSARPSRRRRPRRLMPERVARVSRCASAAAGWVASSTTPSRASPAVTRLRQQRVVADAADRQHVEPLDARARRAPSRARAACRPPVSPAVATPSVTSRTRGAPALARRIVGQPSAARARDPRRPARAARRCARRTTSPSALASPGEDRRHVLIERRHGQHRVGAGLAQLRDQALRAPRPASREPERARGAGVDQDQQRRDVVARGRCRRAARCAPPPGSRRAGPGGRRAPACATSKSRSGVKSRLSTSTTSCCTRSPPRLDAALPPSRLCRPARGSTACRAGAARAAAGGTARSRASAPASTRR